MKRKVIFVIVLVIVLLGVTGYYGYTNLLAPTDSAIGEQKITKEQQRRITTRISKLDTPWSIAEMPENRLLVTERNGTLRIIGENGQIFKIADVVEQGEGGLHGVALHPEFRTNNYIYIYKTTGQTNVVERYKLADNKLSERTDILAGIPAANVHNGGAVAFGPDKKLYITTGDAAKDSRAQDTADLAGKILRVNDDGTVPDDNPFGNAVWSYGHRNPQGIAWDNRKRLWATEHGPSGINSGYDELNKIEKGKNYGWPLVYGDKNQDNMVAPVVQSGGNDTWAPAGITYANGALYFAGLRGQTLYKASLIGET